jgi:FKBP-type peptidyl-prolyl cis-trans isomerase 2
MIVSEKAIVSMRYAMKNSQGELLTSLEDSPLFTFLPGSGTVLPALESVLFGMAAGEKKTVYVSRKQGFAGLDDDFYFDIVIDNVREASEEEIMNGQPFMEIPANECSSDCACRRQNPI